MNFDKVEQPKLAQHDSSVLDLAFCMDCTGSMGSYIENARNSIRHIVEEIVSSEKSDVHLALVEYRDHPPQESTYITQAHDFTSSIKEMKARLDACSAQGGGDAPEAVADGLHDVLKLSWREKSTKICVLISDAPPHGLDPSGDTMPNGCPCGIDPMQVVRQMAEKGITLYSVGCEPALNPYKEFYTGLAYTTGGQYVPLRNANLLSKVIIGGAQEEISLEKLMEDVQAEVQAQVDLSGGIVNESFLAEAVHKKLASKGAVTKNLRLNDSSLEGPSETAMNYSKMASLSSVQEHFVKTKPVSRYDEAPHLESFMMAAPRAEYCVAECSFRSEAAAPSPAPSSAPLRRNFEEDLMSVSSAEAPKADTYTVATDLINIEQTQRLVQKALYRNNLNKS